MADHKEIMVEKNHYLIMPSDPLQRDFTDLVERATRSTLMNDYRIRMNPAYTTTFACVYLESIVTVLSKVMKTLKQDTEINFLDLFTVGVTNRDAEHGDKDGNLNVSFTPGPIVQSIMERDYAPKVNPEGWKGTILQEVEKECAMTLSKKHKAVVDYMYNLTIIAYVYFEGVFRTLKLHARDAQQEGKMASSINFLEMVEIHCNLESIQNPENPDLTTEKFTVKMRPGFEAKLLIKSDDLTEDDE